MSASSDKMMEHRAAVAQSRLPVHDKDWTGECAMCRKLVCICRFGPYRPNDPSDEAKVVAKIRASLEDGQFTMLAADSPKIEILSTITVYLAGHISSDGYRDVATTYLEHHGFKTLNPFRPERDFRGKEDTVTPQQLVEWDIEDINNSRAVLADLTIPSAGTSMECWYAHSIGRPVYPFVEKGGRISPWINYVAKDNRTFPSLSDALLSIMDDFVRND